jgi:iron complex transport system substrate-binding protein
VARPPEGDGPLTSWSHPAERIRARRGRLAAAIVLAAIVLAAAALAACQPSAREAGAEDYQVTDRAGRTVRLSEPARRVASLIPSATDWILAMGAADRLVVRTDHDQSPLLSDVPSVGGGLTPSVEWIAARRPDLVIAWSDGTTRSTVARLEAIGIPVYVATAETIEEGLSIANDLGRLLGTADTTQALIDAVRAGLADVSRRARGAPGGAPSVLFLIGLDPVTGAGSGTFVEELVIAAGGRNALADLPHAWPPLSIEEVLRRDPDAILVGTTATSPLDLVRGRPGWRALTAVQRGRVHPVHPDLVGRWGPHLPAAADSLARLIHGANLP